MESAVKHYYRAVVWHHVGNSREKALREVYRAFEDREAYPQAAGLARRLGTRSSLAESPWNRRAADEQRASEILYFLEIEDKDRFFTAFLSHEAIDEFALRQIDWEGWMPALAKSSEVSDRVWFLILRQNRENALALWGQHSKGLQGNVVGCFQVGYLLFREKQYARAETYLKSILRCGGIYRMAALRILVQFPSRGVESLAGVAGLCENASVEELLCMAEIFQDSQDQAAFHRTLQIAAPKLGSAGDRLKLARFYSDEGDYGRAARWMREAFRRFPEELPRLLEMISGLPVLCERPTLRFLKWLAKRVRRECDLLRLAEIARRDAPQIALWIYGRLQKQSADLEAVALGRAAALLQTGDRPGASLELAKAVRADLAAEKSAWQAQLEFLEGRGSRALEILQEALAQFADSRLVRESMLRLCEKICPACGGPRESPVCDRCGYRSRRMFSWEQGKLRWTSSRLFFPNEWILLTTDSQVYGCDQPVHLILFSTCSYEVSISFLLRGTVVRKKKFGVVPGLVVVREESFAPGLYEIRLQRAGQDLHRHIFLVGGQQAGLKITLLELECPSQTRIEWELEFRDFLGFPVSGEIRLHAFTPFYPWEERRSVAVEKGRARVTWNMPQWRGFGIMAAACPDGRKGTLIVSPYKVASRSEIQEIVTQYHQVYSKSLPVRLENVAGDRVSIVPLEKDRDAVVMLQPIGEAPVRSFRFGGSEKIEFSLEAALSGFYLGLSRFPAGSPHQEAGVETCGLLVGSSLDVSLQGPERAEPGSTFSVSVETGRPVKGVLISTTCPDRYHPLGAHFLQKMADILSDFDRPSETAHGDLYEPSGTEECELRRQEDDFCEVRLFSSPGSIVLDVAAREIPGPQQLVCVVSDGRFFAESSLDLEVFAPCRIDASFPTAIGLGDCVEHEVICHSEEPSRFAVSSAVHGLLHEETVHGESRFHAHISAPDVFTVSLGEQERRCPVGAIETRPAVHASLWRLAENQECLEPVAVYPSGIELAADIAAKLLEDPHRDIETMASQIHCCARLYQNRARGDRDAEIWRSEIERRSGVLAESIGKFPDGRLGYAPGFPPDRRILENVLHHVSPFLEMPRFAAMHDAAKRLLDAALAWKIASNGLFYLSVNFQDSRLKTPESAAGALRSGLHTRKALKRLGKWQKRGPAGIFWSGDSLGGDEQTTALACDAYREHRYSIDEILPYFRSRWRDGVLANPTATAAFVDLLFGMEVSPARLRVGGETVEISGKTTLEEPFLVEKGAVWCRRDQPGLRNLSEEFAPRNLGLKWEGPSELRVGGEFRFHLKTAAAYPHLQILIAPNCAVIRGMEVFRDYMVWPDPSKTVRIECKALFPGIANFHFLSGDRYGPARWSQKYPVTVIA